MKVTWILNHLYWYKNWVTKWIWRYEFLTSYWIQTYSDVFIIIFYLVTYLLNYLLIHSFTYFSYAFFFFSGRNKEQIMKLEVTKKQKQFFFSKKDNACLFIVVSPYTLICHCIQNLHSVIQLLKFCVFPVNYLFLQCCMHPICSMCWNNFRRCCRHIFEYQNKDVM